MTWWHHGAINIEQNSYLEAADACDQIAVVSESCSAMLSDVFPAIDKKLVIIPNMVDADTIRKKAEAFQPYMQTDTLHIVTLCRLSLEKHIENVILAAQKLKEAGFSFQWHLVGDGVLHDRLVRCAEDVGVTDCFIFEGNQPNPYPYLKYADLFVHPSYVESQGLVVLEAMALGIPCVVTKSLGPCEFIEDGINGILTEQSPESLAERVFEILTNQNLYARIKSNTRCPKRFAPENVMLRIDNMLGEL